MEAPSNATSRPRLLDQYHKTLVPEFMKRFGHKNLYEVPRLTKVVVSMGMGKAVEDVKLIERAAQELAVITGQKPLTTRAKVAISNFKVKKGQPVGLKVTLRHYRMYEFLDRLISVAMPRIRDFRGMSPKGCDAGGNFAFGLTEQLIFPEIEYDKVSGVQGMNVVICSTSKTKEGILALLKGLGMPFRES
jgi:large subunit ribosomal protein L5